MKRLFKLSYLLAFSILLLTSCSSNDDGDNSIKTLSEQFIGVWKPVKYVVSCASGEEIESSSTCEQKGRLTISTNGTWVETYFNEYNDVCEDEGTSGGTWTINNGNLKVSENAFGDIDITFFEISGNTLRLGQYDNELCDDDVASSHYYMEYIRI